MSKGTYTVLLVTIFGRVYSPGGEAKAQETLFFIKTTES
jgi:hypothetical protein